MTYANTVTSTHCHALLVKGAFISFIFKLSCRLVFQTFLIQFTPLSLVSRIYRASQGVLLTQFFRRAPAQPTLENTEGPASDLIDVDSPHISEVKSDFKQQAQQTSTQAERMAKEAEAQARQASDQAAQKTSEASQEASKYGQKASEKGDELSKDASKKFEKGKQEASEKGEKAKQAVSEYYREGKKEAEEVTEELRIKAGEARDDLNANRDNPVVVGNAIAWTIGGVALGIGAYNKHVKGELDWGVVGAAAGVVGVLAVGDYFLSK